MAMTTKNMVSETYLRGSLCLGEFPENLTPNITSIYPYNDMNPAQHQPSKQLNDENQSYLNVGKNGDGQKQSYKDNSLCIDQNCERSTINHERASQINLKPNKLHRNYSKLPETITKDNKSNFTTENETLGSFYKTAHLNPHLVLPSIGLPPYNPVITAASPLYCCGTHNDKNKYQQQKLRLHQTDTNIDNPLFHPYIQSKVDKDENAKRSKPSHALSNTDSQKLVQCKTGQKNTNTIRQNLYTGDGNLKENLVSMLGNNEVKAVIDNEVTCPQESAAKEPVFDHECTKFQSKEYICGTPGKKEGAIDVQTRNGALTFGTDQNDNDSYRNYIENGDIQLDENCGNRRIQASYKKQDGEVENPDKPPHALDEVDEFKLSKADGTPASQIPQRHTSEAWPVSSPAAQISQKINGRRNG